MKKKVTNKKLSPDLARLKKFRDSSAEFKLEWLEAALRSRNVKKKIVKM